MIAASEHMRAGNGSRTAGEAETGLRPAASKAQGSPHRTQARATDRMAGQAYLAGGKGGGDRDTYTLGYLGGRGMGIVGGAFKQQ